MSKSILNEQLLIQNSEELKELAKFPGDTIVIKSNFTGHIVQDVLKAALKDEDNLLTWYSTL